MLWPEKVFASIDPAQTQAGGAFHSVVWKVSRDLPYFAGHFPNSPIMPAIAIFDASTLILQRTLQQPELRIKKIKVAKFLTPIVPDQVVRIELTLLAKGEWGIEWKEEATANVLATLKVQI